MPPLLAKVKGIGGLTTGSTGQVFHIQLFSDFEKGNELLKEIKVC